MSISRISQPQDRHQTSLVEQPAQNENASCFEKVSEIYQRYVVNNKYLNEVIHYVFVGVGFALGMLIVIWAGKDIILEVFKHCMCP